MKNFEQIKQEIERRLNNRIVLKNASDCVNLLYIATINNIIVARIYKSFDKSFNKIIKINYTGVELSDI